MGISKDVKEKIFQSRMINLLAFIEYCIECENSMKSGLQKMLA